MQAWIEVPGPKSFEKWVYGLIKRAHMEAVEGTVPRGLYFEVAKQRDDARTALERGAKIAQDDDEYLNIQIAEVRTQLSALQEAWTEENGRKTDAMIRATAAERKLVAVFVEGAMWERSGRVGGDIDARAEALRRYPLGLREEKLPGMGYTLEPSDNVPNGCAVMTVKHNGTPVMAVSVALATGGK
jgi:hypothetical protein